VVNPAFFYTKLKERGTDFFTGVPDSLLKSFCAYVADYAGDNHITAVNEGAAVALASGYHLATGKIPLVYMQNSGIGNAVNPLLSLTDPTVYSVPVLLVVGWRGEPGVQDEPQHAKQGRVTEGLFRAMEIPYAVLGVDEGEIEGQLAAAYAHLREKSSPYALLVRKNIFVPYASQNGEGDKKAEMSREEAIEEILKISREGEFYFSTTGMASRELYELREKLGQDHRQDFLAVGSMGHASQIALGTALQRPGAPITCIDGDGAVLMHLGALAAIGNRKPRNFRHILLNNGAHDSVGGQPTIARDGLDFSAIARTSGYKNVYSVHTRLTLRSVLERIEDRREGPVFVEVQVGKGARQDLGRPGLGPLENKALLMSSLRESGDEFFK
jgi:phosphonopyruvate decarboxylase